MAIMAAKPDYFDADHWFYDSPDAPAEPLPKPHTVIAIFKDGPVKLHARDYPHANWIVDRIDEQTDALLEYVILEGHL